MSEPKWTLAQQAAIEDRGGALLVSAAAGSGKTAVLTERAVRLITDPEHPVDADRLLIVTFTNAAAAELRARIGQALLKRSQRQWGSPAGLFPERNAGKRLPRPGFLCLCRPLWQGPHRPCGGRDDPACLRFSARPARLRQKAGRISGSVAGGKRLCCHLLA